MDTIVSNRFLLGIDIEKHFFLILFSFMVIICNVLCAGFGSFSFLISFLKEIENQVYEYIRQKRVSNLFLF